MFTKPNILIVLLFFCFLYSSFVKAVNNEDWISIRSLENFDPKESFNASVVDEEFAIDDNEEKDLQEKINDELKKTNVVELLSINSDEILLKDERNTNTTVESKDTINHLGFDKEDTFNNTDELNIKQQFPNALQRNDNKKLFNENEFINSSIRGENIEQPISENQSSNFVNENKTFQGVLSKIVRPFFNKSENSTINKNFESEVTDEALLNNRVKNNSPKASCYSKVDLIFLLDTSGSIEQIYHEHVRWAVALIEGLPIEQDTVRVAAVQYAGFPLTEFALGTYPSAEDIRQHLSQINFQSGVTRTGYALRKVEEELFRSDRGARDDAKKIIVLFTDGLSIDDPLKPANQLRELKNVTIYVASVSNDGFQPEMNRIAGSPNNVFGPEDLSRLRNSIIGEAEQARGCIRIGAKNPFINKKSSSQNDNLILKLKQSAAPSNFSNPNNSNSTNNLNSINNSTEIILSTLSSAFNMDKKELKNLQNGNISDEVLKELLAVSEEEEFLFKGNLSHILFKEFNTSDLLMKFDASSEEISSEKSDQNLLNISTLFGFEKFPQPSTKKNGSFSTFESTTIALKSQQNFENGEKDVFDISNDHSRSFSTTTKPSTITEINKIREKIESTTIANIKKKIHVTFKPKPLAIIAPLGQKINIKVQNNKKRFEGIDIIPDSRFNPSNRIKFTTAAKPFITNITTILPISKHFATTGRTTLSPTIRSTKETRKQFGVQNRQFNQEGSSTCLIDLLFIVDSSGSVQKVYDQQKDYLTEVLERVQMDSGSQRVALLQFAGAETQKTEWMYDTFENKVQLMNAFSQVRHITGTTHIGAALENALKILNSRRSNAYCLVILLSDGFSQDDALKPAEKLKLLNNVEFFSLSISDLSNFNYLTSITGNPENVYVGYSEAQKLRNYLNERLQCRTPNRLG